MKYLFLLLSVFKSWFVKNRKFTVSVMLMFTLSAFAMLFTATVVGNEFLWSSEEENKAAATFYFYTEQNSADKDRLVLSENILDAVSSSESNDIDRVEVDIEVTADKIYDKENISLYVMPVYKNDYTNKIWVIMGNGSSKIAELYNSDQHIISGTGISAENLDAKEKVIVLPEKYGVETGDSVFIFGGEFRVVGITSDKYARISSYFIEQDAVSGGGTLCAVNSFEFDRPMTDETYNLISDAVKRTYGEDKTLSFQKMELSDEPNTIYIVFMSIIGAVVAIFTISGIYYPAIQLCKETTPMLSVFKLCGMRTAPAFGLLFISMYFCLAISFGIASLMLIFSRKILAGIISSFDIRGIFFILSVAIYILVTFAAMLPPIMKLAKSQPIEEVAI